MKGRGAIFHERIFNAATTGNSTVLGPGVLSRIQELAILTTAHFGALCFPESHPLTFGLDVPSQRARSAFRQPRTPSSARTFLNQGQPNASECSCIGASVVGEEVDCTIQGPYSQQVKLSTPGI